MWLCRRWCQSRLVGGSYSDGGVIIFYPPAHLQPFACDLVVALTSILFSLLGFINAVFANTFDDISIVPTFVLTPLTYLGGVFYSLDLLPDFWATVSQANPLVYVVSAFRFGMLGVSDVNIAFAISMILLCMVVAFWYSLHLLRTGKRLRT